MISWPYGGIWFLGTGDCAIFSLFCSCFLVFSLFFSFYWKTVKTSQELRTNQSESSMAWNKISLSVVEARSSGSHHHRAEWKLCGNDVEIMSENDVERAAERPIVSSNCQTWRRRALALAQLSQQNGITSTTINRCIPRKSIKTGPPRPVGGLCKTSNNWRAFSRCFTNTGAPPSFLSVIGVKESKQQGGVRVSQRDH